MDSAEWLKIVNDKCKMNTGQTSNNSAKDLKESVEKVSKIKACLDNLVQEDDGYASLILEIVGDLFNSIYFASAGYYRVAFQSLRSALELGISFIRFLDDKYSYYLWRGGCYDNSWSDLNCIDTGIYRYLEVKCSTDKELLRSLKSEAKDIYRLCSEYVHGKYSYMQQLNAPKLEYDLELFGEFINSFSITSNILISIYEIRGGSNE